MSDTQRENASAPGRPAPAGSAARAPSEFQAAQAEHHITEWIVGECSICRELTRYVFMGDLAMFDGACGCAWGPLRPASWSDVAALYNRQSNPEVRAEMDGFWHFTD